MRKTKYRLLCTATAAPNDYPELGTSSEALGYLGYMDMLSMFFRNDKNSLHPAFAGAEWRLKGHAERDFWRWIVSWARACRRPSDLGFEDGNFILPELVEVEHVIESPPPDNALFSTPARTLAEQRADVRLTIRQRCERAAALHDREGADLAGRLNANGDNERGWALLERLDRGLGLWLSTKATSNERGSALP